MIFSLRFAVKNDVEFYNTLDYTVAEKELKICQI